LQSDFANQLNEIGIAQHPLAMAELHRLSYETVQRLASVINQSSRGNLENKLRMLDQQQESLQNERDKLKSELQITKRAFQGQVDDLESKNQQLTSNIIMLESRNDQLTETVERLQVKTTKGHDQSLLDEVAKLKAKIERQEEKLAAKDAESRELLENGFRSEGELKKQLALVE
jgi:chromosome segregation ATPase